MPKSRIDTLLKNNEQWASTLEEQDPAFFATLAQGQSPHFLWIGCADSRMPATSMMGLQPGDMFVHRNIANLASPDDDSVQSIIAFAVGALGVKEIIVCGHYSCGGVKAAAGLSGEPGNVVEQWVTPIRTTLESQREAFEGLDEEAAHRKLCELNVAAQVENVCQHPTVQQAFADQSGLMVHGMIYDIATGRVRDLELSRNS